MKEPRVRMLGVARQASLTLTPYRFVLAAGDEERAGKAGGEAGHPAAVRRPEPAKARARQ
jgi:hypothetical protein